MDDWGIDELVNKGGVMIMDGKKDITKQEQLKTAFKTLMLEMLKELVFDEDVTKEVVIASLDNFADRLLKEVSIRTPLK
jgi:hypothetical protein